MFSYVDNAFTTWCRDPLGKRYVLVHLFWDGNKVAELAMDPLLARFLTRQLHEEAERVAVMEREHPIRTELHLVAPG
jgi:hypothetical protein